MRTVLILWLPPLVYMAAIYYLSAQPNPLPELTTRVWDKLLHGIEYGGLAGLLVRALGGEGLNRRGALLLAILLTSLYGASDEYHQAFVPNRNSTPRDWVADSIGGIVGATAYAAAFRKWRSPSGLRSPQG